MNFPRYTCLNSSPLTGDGESAKQYTIALCSMGGATGAGCREMPVLKHVRNHQIHPQYKHKKRKPYMIFFVEDGVPLALFLLLEHFFYKKHFSRRNRIRAKFTAHAKQSYYPHVN